MGDFRVQTAFFSHPKTVKLRRRCGGDGVVAFLTLWGFCSDNPGRERGDLAGMSGEDIEIAAGWSGEPGLLIVALVDVGYLDGAEGAYRIHDFEEHQPFVATKPMRAASARRANAIRWHKQGRHNVDPQPDCPICYPESESDSDPDAEWSESDSDPDSGSERSGVPPSTSTSTSTSTSSSTSNSNSSGTETGGSDSDRSGVRRGPRPVDIPLRGQPDRRVNEVIEHYCTKYPRRRAQAERRETRTLIKARLAEGYTPEELKRSIDGNGTSEFHRAKGLTELRRIVADAETVDRFKEMAEAQAGPVLTDKTRKTVEAGKAWLQRGSS